MPSEPPLPRLRRFLMKASRVKCRECGAMVKRKYAASHKNAHASGIYIKPKGR